MYCPRCGDVLSEMNETFTCIRGDMEMSHHLATHLFACFVSKSEQPKEPPPLSEMRYKSGVGGRWFCPGCGVSMEEQTPYAVRCPQCNRNLWQFVYEIVECHPHRRDDGRFL
jgi:hypothetical protein